ncbi:hypothetical protein I553_10618 [Mycobacterium xenopi 4042]|uniref:Uncharacterized protein n=1 Tax=Mycobacterium xenopi 4042 TaxID=1299334 RepID=X7ZG51_MYCXE|nr:hypothetical protein I553_10618 [Mycobacterium xenopi 4042]
MCYVAAVYLLSVCRKTGDQVELMCRLELPRYGHGPDSSARAIKPHQATRAATRPRLRSAVVGRRRRRLEGSPRQPQSGHLRRAGCRQPLVPKDCTQSQRHLAYPRGSAGGCGHHILGSDEKPETDRRMSERHRWMQNRITAICRRLGYEAVPEHWPTRADVYVETTKTALEVQQRPTAFAKRTAARARHGACQTIWLLSHDARGDSVERALFGLPAVRFKIVDLRRIGPDRTIEFEPWTDPTALNEFAVVDVWATTWQLVDEKPYLRRCKMDLHIFLDQVLSGRRIWVRANPVMPRGGKHNQAYAGWVLHEDLLEASRRQACDVEDEAKAVAVQPITADRKNTALVAPDQTPKPVAALRPPPVEPPISPERAMKESAAAQTQSPTTTQAKPPRPRQAPHPSARRALRTKTSRRCWTLSR